MSLKIDQVFESSSAIILKNSKVTNWETVRFFRLASAFNANFVSAVTSIVSFLIIHLTGFDN